MMTRTAIHPLKIVGAVAAALLVWGLVLAYASSPAQAADITVNSLADDADGLDGECTLREAITSANNDPTSEPAAGECANGSGDDLINFVLPGTAPWTVNLGSALPGLSTNIDIQGPGADQLTVRRNTGDDYGIFTVGAATPLVVSISGMTISNGDAVACGGGIWNQGIVTLTVTDSTISGNSAAADGGGICSLGTESTVTVTDSTISGNSAAADGGGGGILNGGTLSVSGSTISGNSADVEGGGINNFGTLTVNSSTISDNSAHFGGGINNFGTLTVSGSTISGNTASGGSDPGADGGAGGGIYHGGFTANDDLTITDSTISGNTATAGQPAAGEDVGWGGEGGGIFNDAALQFFDCDPASAITSTTITNSTISGNTAAAGEDAAGGGMINYDGLAVIENSTITNNTAPDGTGSGLASYGDCWTPTTVLSSIISANTNTDVDFVFDTTNSFISNGYNLIGSGNATVDDDPNTDLVESNAFDQTGDQTGVTNPLLGALAENGGPTLTHALLAGSPAIDKGNTDLTADQRGLPRPFDDPNVAPATGGDNSDIGAFEAQEVMLNAAPDVSVAPGGSCSATSDLRGTINLALSDADTPAQELTLSATSSNQAVVPNANITFGGGTDASRSMSVTALKRGTPTLTVTVSDGDLQDSVLVKVRVGTNSIDTLSGLSGSEASSDMILARNGSDTARGWGHIDLLCGGNGNDSLRGDRGDDNLRGGDNNDKLTGDLGADSFVGGSGTDTATDFNAGQGDTMSGIP